MAVLPISVPCRQLAMSSVTPANWWVIVITKWKWETKKITVTKVGGVQAQHYWMELLEWLFCFLLDALIQTTYGTRGMRARGIWVGLPGFQVPLCKAPQLVLHSVESKRNGKWRAGQDTRLEVTKLPHKLRALTHVKQKLKNLESLTYMRELKMSLWLIMFVVTVLTLSFFLHALHPCALSFLVSSSHHSALLKLGLPVKLFVRLHNQIPLVVFALKTRV